MKKYKFGIRKKVMLGFIVIALMLFFSGLVAFIEFGRMSNYVSAFITKNLTSINTTRILLDLCDEYNSNLFQQLNVDDQSQVPELSLNEPFMGYYLNLKEQATIQEEKQLMDSVRYAYAAYMQVSHEVEDVWFSGFDVRRDWYFERLQVVYDKLREYIQRLSLVSQDALTENYDNLRDSYYRSIMPGIVAICAGIILVFLFNYFLNIFLLNPLLKINKGLKSYKEFNSSYDVKFDYGGDQVQELNEAVKDMIEENKSLKRK